MEARFPFTTGQTHRKIQYADAMTKISALADILPSTESHVRELLKLESDKDRALVWQAVAGILWEGWGIVYSKNIIAN